MAVHAFSRGLGPLMESAGSTDVEIGRKTLNTWVLPETVQRIEAVASWRRLKWGPTIRESLLRNTAQFRSGLRGQRDLLPLEWATTWRTPETAPKTMALGGRAYRLVCAVAEQLGWSASQVLGQHMAWMAGQPPDWMQRPRCTALAWPHRVGVVLFPNEIDALKSQARQVGLPLRVYARSQVGLWLTHSDRTAPDPWNAHVYRHMVRAWTRDPEETQLKLAVDPDLVALADRAAVRASAHTDALSRAAARGAACRGVLRALARGEVDPL